MAKTQTLSYNQLINSLNKKEFYPIYFLYGDENYYIDEITNHIEANALDATAKDFNQTILYGKDVDYKTILDAARRFPIMSTNQLVVVKEAQDLKTMDKLESYFENPMESTILVFAYKHKKLDGRKKFVSKLKKSSKACLFESKRLYENQVPNWINNYLKDKNISIKPAATNLLAEYLGTDLSKISNELNKLTINLSEGVPIDKSIIQKNIGISKDFNVFELQNALGKKDRFKSLLIVKYFIANPKNHPLQLITATLYNFFSKVFVCQSMMQSSDKAIASALGTNPFFVKDYKVAAKSYNRIKLEQIIATLKEYDLRSKGVDNVSVSQGELLREMIIKILG
ncbi:MAG: DNA polymerase III subunit delta [Saprospiraceae bacterium]|nr:DNA polymerase III subunit delta [Saprospiraceae bacterium]